MMFRSGVANRVFLRAADLLFGMRAILVEIIKMKGIAKSEGSILLKDGVSRVNPLKLVDIPVGAELVYVRDENVTVRVVDERRVEYNNEIFYLAPLSQKLLGYARSVQGALYWTYEGETLDVRRRRLELGG